MRHHVSWYTLREGREKGEGKIERKERKREARVKAELLKKQWGEGVGRVSPLSRYLHRPVFIFKHPSEIEREATDPFRLSARRCFCTKYTEFSLLLRCSLFLHSCINIGQVDQVLRGIISQMNFRTVLLLAVFARDNDTANINTEPTSNFYKYLLNVLYQAFLTFPCMQYILINMYTR